MSLINDFKAFAMRGNVVDLAVGVVIGSAFGRIVTSFVNDVIMPPIGLALGGVDFKGFAITLKPAVDGGKAVAINYGAFITTITDFLIIAFAIFMLVKVMNKLPKVVAPVPTTKDCPECLMAIPIAAKRCGHCTSIF